MQIDANNHTRMLAHFFPTKGQFCLSVFVRPYEDTIFRHFIEYLLNVLYGFRVVVAWVTNDQIPDDVGWDEIG